MPTEVETMRIPARRNSGIAIFALLILAFGCATSSDTSRAGANATTGAVELTIEQLPDAGFAAEDRGATSIAYQMTVQNRSGDPVTLRRIEMKTVGRSPYTLRNAP